MAETDNAASERIPLELLCEIFTLAVLPLNELASGFPVIKRRRANRRVLGGPWAISHVSRLWRTQALSLPTLWSTVLTSTRITARELPLLHEQLARTGTASLDVFLCVPSWSQPSDNVFAALLNILRPSYHRWRRLRLHVNGALNPSPAFFTIGPFPLLEELVFSGLNPHTFGLIGVETTVFANAPRLKTVILSECGQDSVRKIDLPWRQLVVYKATYAMAESHLPHLLAMANTLVEADLGVDMYDSQPAWGSNVAVILPRLQRLVVTRNSILRKISAPALADLYVEEETSCVLSFLVRSACTKTLHRLTLCNSRASSDELLAILKASHSLKHLSLDFCTALTETSGHLIRALGIPSPTSQARCLCPNLVSLAWADRSNILGSSAFVDMLQSRWRLTDPHRNRGIRRLSKLSIYLGRFGMQAKHSRLDELREEGLRVTVINSFECEQLIAQWRQY